MFFLSTLTFNLAVVAIMLNGVYVIMSGAIELILISGTFGILDQKRSKEDTEYYLTGIEKILPKTISSMLVSRKEKDTLYFNEQEATSIIDGLHEKFGNIKGHVNFFISSALMIGLLGTFTGLIQAVDDMGKIILSLSGDDIDLKALMADFAGPLGGMAVGFGSSIFGVIAALLLGIKSFILYRNQEELIAFIEDWLRERTVELSTDEKALNDASRENARVHFIDVFVEQTSQLKHEITKISASEEKIVALGKNIVNIDKNIDKKRKILESLEHKYNENNQQVGEKLKNIVTQNYTILKDITNNHIESSDQYDGLITHIDTNKQVVAALQDDMKQTNVKNAHKTEAIQKKLDNNEHAMQGVKEGLVEIKTTVSGLDTIKKSIGTLFNFVNKADEKLLVIDNQNKVIDTKVSGITEINKEVVSTKDVLVNAMAHIGNSIEVTKQGIGDIKNIGANHRESMQKDMQNIGNTVAVTEKIVADLSEKENTHIEDLKKEISYLSHSVNEVLENNKTIETISEKLTQLGSDIFEQKDAFKDIVNVINETKQDNIVTLNSIKDALSSLQNEIEEESNYNKKVGNLQTLTSQKTLDTHKTVMNLQNMVTTMVKALKASYTTTQDIHTKLERTFKAIETNQNENPNELKQSISALTRYGAILQQNLKKELNDLSDVKKSINDINEKIKDLDVPKKSDLKLDKLKNKSDAGFMERVFLGKK